MNILVFLALLFKIYCQEDYYKLLGVSRDCDEQALKRQFKKLSLKYHPDKNRGNAEKNKEHFAKIVNAYEVLKDPKTRKVYDQRGKKGVEEYLQNPNAGEGFNNFGGGRGGFHNFGGFNNFGGGAHFQFEDFFQNDFQQEKKAKPLFENTDVFEINMKTITSFFRRNEVWLILFYKADEQSSQQKKDEWINLAQKYYGIFKVAAVDCLEEEVYQIYLKDMCDEEFGIKYFPQVLAYPSNIDYEQTRFNGEFNEKELANFAVKYMESFVEYVTQENYKEFIKRDLYKVLLFTDKKSTPPLYKALSKDFKGKLIFGEVRSTTSPLIKHFNIQKIPSLVVITDSENYQCDIYSSQYKKDQIQKFLRDYQNKNEENKVKIIFDINQACKDINLCLILGTKNPKQRINNLNFLQKQYNMIQMYILESKHEFAVIVKGKKQRYTFQFANNDDSLKEFLDDTIAGGRQFEKITENWPVQLRIQKLPETEQQDLSIEL